MSESEGLQRHVESISALHHGRDVSLGHWSAPVTPTFASGFSFEDDQDHHHAKKSILGKVKEKAKKWRHMLAKKKHGHDDDNLTPPWGVSLDEEDDEQDPEYHGAPMYESETAPETYREGTSRPRPAVQSPSAVEKSAVFQLHNANKESEMKRDSVANRSLLHNMPAHRNPVGENGTKRTLTETVTEMLAPAYTMVSEATQMMASKIQSPGTGYELGAKQVWDKGISVKEYLLHKLEPGEEDRALCQVITEAVSPRKAGEVGIAEKVKEAASSLRGGEELHGTQIPVSARQGPIPVSTNPHAHEAPPPISANLHAHVSPIPVPINLHASESSNPVFTNLQAHVSSIPGSTNPRTDVEIRGRRLQAYTT
ncbi:low-temperature-induced 65 kDa protein-like isoform X2 [Phoenix dactylifera]|uniref:Low-temperature-induced 65 kDa protein-like isoform X2 n=1 Tax=Phoenix dactylifera TaxID=42345 RepID=A0A8B9A9Z4_PHODC|nr:low-temperature-induced 65 kDa protein-like isoform X2 [Phoenix dactylifera]